MLDTNTTIQGLSRELFVLRRTSSGGGSSITCSTAHSAKNHKASPTRILLLLTGLAHRPGVTRAMPLAIYISQSSNKTDDAIALS
jgi:hypothetical protein